MRIQYLLTCLLVIASVLLGLVSCSKKSSIQNQSQDLIIDKLAIGSLMQIIPYRLNNGTYMEIIAVKAGDGSIRTAFNTCEPCSRNGAGYFSQVDDYLLCKSCGENEKFLIDKVGITAEGCYPVPITPVEKTEDEARITIPVKTLEAGQRLFRVWKKQPLL